eukprot:15407662-Alexandrium_andersonii.AAC.1
MHAVHWLWANDAWALHDQLWRSQLLPRHAVVMDMQRKAFFFTIEIFDCAALAWPVKALSAHCVVFEPEPAALEWLVCTSEGQFQ